MIILMFIGTLLANGCGCQETSRNASLGINSKPTPTKGPVNSTSRK